MGGAEKKVPQILSQRMPWHSGIHSRLGLPVAAGYSELILRVDGTAPGIVDTETAFGKSGGVARPRCRTESGVRRIREAGVLG